MAIEERIEPKPAAVPEPKPEVKVEEAPKPEVKVEEAAPKPEVKAEPPAAAAPKTDWRDGRIAELTAKLNAEKAKRVEVPKAANESDADFEARVAARAEVLATEKSQLAEWNSKCNTLFNEGTSLFPDFKDRLGAIQSTVNKADPEEVKGYNEVIAAALETGKAPQLLHELGANPGEFQRLMKLGPVKRGMELATMATKLEATPEPSGAPKPIIPVGGRGDHHEEIKPDDAVRGMKLSTREWMARREKQVIERGLQ